MATELKTASVLAFERKLDPSDALFFAGQWHARHTHADWPSVKVREKSVRGTISNRLKTTGQDPAKLDAAIQNPNLQTVDVAALSLEADTLKVQFTLRVLPGTGKPSAANNAEYEAKLLRSIQSYVQANGFGALSHRYASNLANGRFLWRNRVGAEQVEIEVAHLVDGQAAEAWTFDALALSLRHFDPPADAASDIAAVAALIAAGLAGERRILLRVTAFVRAGGGQEVFPSQELILDRGKSNKSKTLYTVGEGKDAVAAVHSQKIGNALRSIDTWYPGAEDNGPIAVEPYGSVTTQGKAWRQPKQKMDFYNLLDGWILKDKVPELEQQHFVVATLIRGGVFGDAG